MVNVFWKEKGKGVSRRQFSLKMSCTFHKETVCAQNIQQLYSLVLNAYFKHRSEIRCEGGQVRRFPAAGGTESTESSFCILVHSVKD